MMGSGRRGEHLHENSKKIRTSDECVGVGDGHLPDRATGRERIAERQQSLDYVAAMLRELRKIALGTEEKTLTYFIEMAALEAGDRAERLKYQQKKYEARAGD